LLIQEGNPDFKGTGLKRSSVVKLEKLFALQKGLLVGRFGDLSPRLMEEVDARLRIALGLK
jgi:mRNA-degrading endonuclease toxin of MazEF toxin-antitoxin module